MKTSHTISLSVCAGLFLCSIGSAAILVQYGNDLPVGDGTKWDTAAADKQGHNIAPGLTAGNIDKKGAFGAGSNALPVRSAFGNAATIATSGWANLGSISEPATGWYASNMNAASWGEQTSMSEACNGLQFTLSAGSGYAIQLDSVSFDWQIAVNNRAGDILNMYANVFVSADNQSWHSLLSNDSVLSCTGESGKTIYGHDSEGSYGATAVSDNAAVLNYINSLKAENLTFRVAFAGNGRGINTGNSVAVFARDITVNGSIVQAIPEPATGALVMLPLALLALRRRKIT